MYNEIVIFLFNDFIALLSRACRCKFTRTRNHKNDCTHHQVLTAQGRCRHAIQSPVAPPRMVNKIVVANLAAAGEPGRMAAAKRDLAAHLRLVAGGVGVVVVVDVQTATDSACSRAFVCEHASDRRSVSGDCPAHAPLWKLSAHEPSSSRTRNPSPIPCFKHTRLVQPAAQHW